MPRPRNPRRRPWRRSTAWKCLLSLRSLWPNLLSRSLLLRYVFPQPNTRDSDFFCFIHVSWVLTVHIYINTYICPQRMIQGKRDWRVGYPDLLSNAGVIIDGRFHIFQQFSSSKLATVCCFCKLECLHTGSYHILISAQLAWHSTDIWCMQGAYFLELDFCCAAKSAWLFCRTDALLKQTLVEMRDSVYTSKL